MPSEKSAGAGFVVAERATIAASEAKEDSEWRNLVLVML